MLKSFYTNLLLYLITLSTCLSCSHEKQAISLQTGSWRGEIDMQNNVLPFNFEIFKNGDDYQINIINENEKLAMEDVRIQYDSIFFTLHIFDIEIKARITNNSMQGVYQKNYIDDYQLPFRAKFGYSERTDQPESNTKFDGKWEMTFTDENGVVSEGVGIFERKNSKLTGTILTPTGDYRYLGGFTSGSNFTLYSFDGNHAFIFKGTLENETTVKGDFWSGKSFHESFTAVKNENAALPDANKLTFLKEGYDHIDFSFPDLNGKLVSLNDNRFKNKVIILQIFGTWCPNCMDETKFLSQWYKENSREEIAIIGLAYEAKNDFNYAKKRVEKMKEVLDVPYDFLIAGTYDKKEASKTLPMLNQIISFPTTIFIDKKGEVRKIHTGFSGPATGDHYLKFIEEFNQFTDMLLNE